MKKIMGAIVLLFLLAGCSSANLGLSDLKEAYPETFAKPIEDLSEEKQNKIGLPGELPFDVSSVQAKVENNTVTVTYQDSSGESQVTVTTIYNPDNILGEYELNVPLNNGALAGVKESEDQVFVEWFNGEDDVIYQINYTYAKSEKPDVEAIDIANAI